MARTDKGPEKQASKPQECGGQTANVGLRGKRESTVRVRYEYMQIIYVWGLESNTERRLPKSKPKQRHPRARARAMLMVAPNLVNEDRLM